MEIKTRFAPSPTGFLHIGGVRTALYAYLIARKNNGEFKLRIEDTDRTRFVEDAVEDIISTIKWLGLNFDGEVEYQSKRLDIYKKYADQLVSEGKAYLQDGAIWFKINTEGVTEITDLVQNRKLTIPNNEQKDFVILKSDGYPTYHLAHVVDDHLMEINPVIRGQEWISSLPKHIQLFQALGWEPVSYGHLPIILGTDKSKLSKRHGAKATSEFRADGFLPEAILNFMALLGWTVPEGKEIISLEEMIKNFDLKDVHLANPVFDITKLEWMNGEYIRKSEDSDLKSKIREYLEFISEGSITKKDRPTDEDIEKVIPLIKERIKKLSDFIPLTDFLWEKPEYDQQVFTNLLRHPERSEGSHDIKQIVQKILETLEKMEKPWKADSFEKTFRDLAEELGISVSQMFQLIRVCVSGQTVTPPLFESIQILGEEETVNRVKAAASFLTSHS